MEILKLVKLFHEESDYSVSIFAQKKTAPTVLEASDDSHQVPQSKVNHAIARQGKISQNLKEKAPKGIFILNYCEGLDEMVKKQSSKLDQKAKVDRDSSSQVMLLEDLHRIRDNIAKNGRRIESSSEEGKKN